MINILYTDTAKVTINKTMLKYCITIPLKIHYCFDFSNIRNGGIGDDVDIEFNGVTYRGHVNVKHFKNINPAYQIHLSPELKTEIAKLSINNAANTNANVLSLDVDSKNQKLFLK